MTATDTYTIEMRMITIMGYVMKKSRIQATIDYLKSCQTARAQGYPVSLKTDPTWLVNVAINRRAGWPESRFYFASCAPVNGHYPKKADQLHDSTIQLVNRINSKLVVYSRDVPLKWKQRIRRCFVENRTEE